MGLTPKQRMSRRELIELRDQGRIHDWEFIHQGAFHLRTFMRPYDGGDKCPMIVTGYDGQEVVWAIVNRGKPHEFFAVGVTETNEQAFLEADEALVNLTENTPAPRELPTDLLLKYDLMR